MLAKLKYFFVEWVVPWLIGGAIGGAVVFFALYLIIMQPFRPEPEHCSLCDYVPTNAVCIVDTREGRVSNLQLYPPDPMICNGLDDETDGEYGYMSMAGGPYWSVYSFPDDDYLDLSINGDIKYFFDTIGNKKYFCKECREKLDNLKTSNILCFADIYDLENVKVYSIAPGATYHIRHYTVEISDTLNEIGKLQVKISSNYFEGGAALDPS